MKFKFFGLLVIFIFTIIGCGSGGTTNNYILDKDNLKEYETIEIFKEYAKHDGDPDITKPTIEDYKILHIDKVNNETILKLANESIANAEVAQVESPSLIVVLLYETGVLESTSVSVPTTLVLSPMTLTPSPTVALTPSPTVALTPSPTVVPTPSPTVAPTPSPTVALTPSPTVVPTVVPTNNSFINKNGISVKFDFEFPSNTLTVGDSILNFNPKAFEAKDKDGNDITKDIKVEITYQDNNAEYNKEKIGKYRFVYSFNDEFLDGYAFTIKEKETVISTPTPTKKPTGGGTKTPTLQLNGAGGDKNSPMEAFYRQITFDPGIRIINGDSSYRIKQSSGDGTFIPTGGLDSHREYEIKYSLIDSSGHSVYSVTRWIRIVPKPVITVNDTTPPVYNNQKKKVYFYNPNKTSIEIDLIKIVSDDNTEFKDLKFTLKVEKDDSQYFNLTGNNKLNFKGTDNPEDTFEIRVIVTDKQGNKTEVENDTFIFKVNELRITKYDDKIRDKSKNSKDDIIITLETTAKKPSEKKLHTFS